jgi:hypothetical protein
MSPITWQKLLISVKITDCTDKGSTPNGKFTAPIDTQEEGKIS